VGSELGEVIAYLLGGPADATARRALPYSEWVPSDLITIEATPRLRAPVLGLALTGWVDAGLAGIRAVDTLTAQFDPGVGRRIATLELADLLDLQATRPTVSLTEGITRVVEWPRIEFFAGSISGRHVIVCRGPEPSLRWPSVGQAIAGFASELGVARAYTFGAIPANVSHRQPIQVLATASDPTVAAGLPEVRPDYEGPTGLQTVVQSMLGDAGVPTVGLWAQVPHYVAGNPAPAATRALLEHFVADSGIPLPLHELDEASEEWRQQVETGLADRPDVLELVAQIEAANATAAEAQLPSGDELASEIERYLRGE
jgi:hypothetical protein